jgi:hypothetical protein
VKLPELDSLPAKITKRWPMAEPAKLLSPMSGLASFPIDHSIGPVKTPKKHDSSTIASALRGIFKTNQSSRAEVLSLISQKPL